jgi:hypothetical protein
MYVFMMFCFSTLPTKAEFWDGNNLYEMCQKDRNVAAMYVMGGIDIYIGISNGLMQNGVPNSELLFCLSSRVTGSQAGDVVCKWLRDNPSSRHLTSSGVIILSLGQSFPCNK